MPAKMIAEIPRTTSRDLVECMIASCWWNLANSLAQLVLYAKK
jgi:hypothetical protein